VAFNHLYKTLFRDIATGKFGHNIFKLIGGGLIFKINAIIVHKVADKPPLKFLNRNLFVDERGKFAGELFSHEF
jgi:hypothetical protein